MKIRTFISTLSLALIGMMMVNAAALAQGRSGEKGSGGYKMDKAMARLNLTAEQKAKIQALRDQFKQNHAATFSEIKALRNQMRQLKESGQGKNSDQMRALRDQIKAKMEVLRPAQEQLRTQILNVLTPEQRAEMEKMKAERKGKKGDKKGKKRGKGSGQGNGQGNGRGNAQGNGGID